MMPTSPDGFNARIASLKSDLVAQAGRVQALVEASFESAFARDEQQAGQVLVMDEDVDKVDVGIEKAAVQLLTDATAEGAHLPAQQTRLVLTIVKINNELERIADAGVAVAEEVKLLQAATVTMPPTFRVMTNSVVGILRDSAAAFARGDAKLARVVLASEDAVEEFKKALIRDVQQRIAAGTISLDAAFSLQEVATYCEIMAGHCTNIAEQVLYSETGEVVRHMGGHWQKFSLPA
jgi:phosphate transport system protein